MRFLPVIVLLLLCSRLPAQQEEDPAPVHRPRYFGAYCGALVVADPARPIYTNELVALPRMQTLEATVGNAFQAGVLFTHPFFRRMEWQYGGGVHFFEHEKLMAVVTSMSPPPYSVIHEYYTWRYQTILLVYHIHSTISVELVRRPKLTLLAGAGGWLAGHKTPYNFGPFGLEAGLTTAIRFHPKGALRIRLTPGWMDKGFYGNATIALCYVGQRTFTAR